MASPPSTFRAWQYTTAKGGLENNLNLNPSAPLPKSKPSQHLIQIIATALNPVDCKTAESPIISLLISKPATPGIDFSGKIVTPATGSSLKPGQLVFGVAALMALAGGALQEYAHTPKECTVAIPDGVDPIDASTIGIAGLTAYQSIVPKVKEGDKIFINGGSGGTGAFGIQIAKALGCHVTTTCSTSNVELCKSLGADEVVDYKKQNIIETLIANGHKFDHVVDNVGSDFDLYWRCHEYTNPNSVFVLIAGAPTLNNLAQSIKMKHLPRFLGGGKRRQEGFLANPNMKDLEQLVAWMKEGKVKAVIDERFPFEDAPKAFEKLKTGRAKGKIVIDVASVS
jgi:NADPH:quinone reductase-like Zn-dependent oxidoreductase